MNIYIVLRNNVLTPILKDATSAVLKSNLAKNSTGSSDDLNGKSGESSNDNDTPSLATTNGGGNGSNGATSDFNLCAGIRQAYSILLRVSQLENHLFDSLFKPASPAGDGGNNGPSSNVGQDANTNMFSGVEILTIVENICGTTGDAMR